MSVSTIKVLSQINQSMYILTHHYKWGNIDIWHRISSWMVLHRSGLAFLITSLNSEGWEEAENISPGQRDNLLLPDLMGRCDSRNILQQIYLLQYTFLSYHVKKKNIYIYILSSLTLGLAMCLALAKRTFMTVMWKGALRVFVRFKLALALWWSTMTKRSPFKLHAETQAYGERTTPVIHLSFPGEPSLDQLSQHHLKACEFEDEYSLL